MLTPMPPDAAALADRLAARPDLRLELVRRLGLIAAMPPTAATAGTVAAWAAQVLAALEAAPGPVPPPVPPPGRPALTVTPDPASRYEFWAVAPACDALAHRVGFVTDVDAAYVRDTASIHGGRLAELVRRAVALGADVVFTAADAP